MKYLLSLPENTVASLPEKYSGNKKFFPCSDPKEGKVGSGGGTSWILSRFWQDSEGAGSSFNDWLKEEKRIIIHGGGQSRRLPAYAPLGKSFIPSPIFRWERGQRLDQTLLDLQLPLLENLLSAAPDNINTMIASGDALILSEKLFDNLPAADVISLGMSVDPALASNHGVFVCSRTHPEKLKYMLQKPDKAELKELNIDNLFYIDTGIWVLSDKAVSLILERSGWDSEKEEYKKSRPDFYDLYGAFGLSLGETPSVSDDEISALSTAIIPLSEGDFYHFGTSEELIQSSLQIQNKVVDQRDIWTKNIKPHPSIFTQNCIVDTELGSHNENLWIENSHLNRNWKLNCSHIITGVPENEWALELSEGLCLDLVPLKSGKYCIRPYGINDKFRGSVSSAATTYLGVPVLEWLNNKNLTLSECGFSSETDIYEAALFPAINKSEIDAGFIRWLIGNQDNSVAHKKLWLGAERYSSSQLLLEADLSKLQTQRKAFRKKNLQALYKNHKKSVFFHSDLSFTADEYKHHTLDLPEKLEDKDPLIQMQDMMFRSRLSSDASQSEQYRDKAFEILQSAILEPIAAEKQLPKSNVYEDQIVWSRSPVRIDLAGGWTDTPPNSNFNGGSVVNVSLELNGQPPLQAFVRPCKEKNIILRSIDLGERQIINTFSELRTYNIVGSPFSIPKAALALAGFLPEYCSYKWPSLKSQLEEFGCGIEISFLAAIPKGSGMGTSSILAATILGAVSDFSGLNWDFYEICNRTLGLEQLLTTGGGWQDQYGGVVPGLKLLSTERGWGQTPDIKWLPDFLFTKSEYKESMLLYYTGITRVAKSILSDIVEGMFLNNNDIYRVLKELKRHANDTFEVIQRGMFEEYGRKIARSWKLNQEIDSGTNNENIQAIIDRIEDCSLGYKLPGAGGGGFLYIVAKDPEAAVKIKKILTENPPNRRARFVDMSISNKGLQVSRS